MSVPSKEEREMLRRWWSNLSFHDREIIGPGFALLDAIDELEQRIAELEAERDRIGLAADERTLAKSARQEAALPECVRAWREMSDRRRDRAVRVAGECLEWLASAEFDALVRK